MSAFQWTLRVTATESETAQVVARRQQFAVGRPLHFDADYRHLTALEYGLGAIGAEIVNGLRVFARRRRIEIDAIEALVSGELDNPFTYLEVAGEQGDAGLSYVKVTVYIASPEDEQRVRALWAEVRERLPLVRTFSRATRVTVELRFAAV